MEKQARAHMLFGLFYSSFVSFANMSNIYSESLTFGCFRVSDATNRDTNSKAQGAQAVECRLEYVRAPVLFGPLRLRISASRPLESDLRIR